MRRGLGASRKLTGVVKPNSFVRRPLKQVVKRVRHVFGQATRGMRRLPDFFIVGVQKGGTTSLYNYLCRHPGVAPASVGEVHFFDENYHRGVEWYRGHFPSWFYDAISDVRLRTRPLAVDCTPCYLFHPPAAERIARLLPESRAVALLRDPVERAHSHYRHRVRKGTETRSFAEAIEHEIRVHEDGDLTDLSEQEYDSLEYKWDAYLSRGLYADQIENWRRYFPADQLLLLRSEDFFADPLHGLRQVYAFLELEEWEPAEFPRYNYFGSHVDMDSGLRRVLEQFFTEPNRRLAEFLEWEPGWGY